MLSIRYNFTQELLKGDTILILLSLLVGMQDNIICGSSVDFFNNCNELESKLGHL